MKHFLAASLLSLIPLLVLSGEGNLANQEPQAQDEARTPDPDLPLIKLQREFKNSLPIPAGEKLEYEVRYSRFPIYASVGIVTFEYLGEYIAPAIQEISQPDELTGENKLPEASTVNHDSEAEKVENKTQPEPPLQGLNVDYRLSPETRLLHLRATAVSKGFLITLLGIDVKDRFETIVNGLDFSARLSLTEYNEGKKHVVQGAFFDTDGRLVKYRIDDLANPEKPPQIKELPLDDGMMSLLSAFYYVRFQKYKEGHLIRFPVSSDGENYLFDIVVGKKEKVKTDCGKAKAVIIEPLLFGPGKFFKRKGEMKMWMTDDKRHIPLRLVAKTSAGTITAKLLNYKNNCQILDPDIEKPERATADDRPPLRDRQ